MRRTNRHLQDQPKPSANVRIAVGARCVSRQRAATYIGLFERFVLDTGYAPAVPAIRETTSM